MKGRNQTVKVRVMSHSLGAPVVDARVCIEFADSEITPGEYTDKEGEVIFRSEPNRGGFVHVNSSRAFSGNITANMTITLD